MFTGCNNLTSLDLSNWNTSNLKGSLYATFSGCSGLTSLNLKNFNTSQVTDMIEMFRNCSALTSLDLSSFNTSQVTDMNGMFRETKNLTIITIGCGWKTAENIQNMFSRSGYTLDKLNALVEEIKPTCPVVSE